MSLKYFVVIILLFSFVPATSQDESTGDPAIESSETVGWKEVQVPFSYQNIQVPRQTWQTIKDILRQDGASEASIEDFSVLPVAVQVDIMSESPRILKDSLNYRVTYVEGGGSLDLFDFVTGKGAFHLRFAPEIDSSSPHHMIYISDSPGKEMDGIRWGNGCGQIYDLTEKSDEFMLEYGVRVSSSRRHYLHLLAGTFLFFQLVEDKLFISYIRLNDSRYPNFNCKK